MSQAPKSSEKPALSDAVIRAVIAQEAASRASNGIIPESAPTPSANLDGDIRAQWEAVEKRLLEECQRNISIAHVPHPQAFEVPDGPKQSRTVSLYSDPLTPQRRGLYLSEGTTAVHWSKESLRELTTNTHCLQELQRYAGLLDVQTDLQLATLEAKRIITGG